MSSWQILLITYTIGAPLVALHARWIMKRRETESPEFRRETEQTMDMTGVSRGGLSVAAGLFWPLILVGYMLTLVSKDFRDKWKP